MASIGESVTAKNFVLNTLKKESFCLSKALKGGAVLLAFFRTVCPASQLLFPYLERLHGYYSMQSIYGISQDNEIFTKEFVARYAIQFSVLLDESCSVSYDYNVMIVPTILWVEPDMTISFYSTGFSKYDLNQLGERIVKLYDVESIPIASPDDGAPMAKPGSLSKRTT